MKKEESISMFRSSSYHTIDAKGRIIIPARFRDVIRAGGGDSLWITNMQKSLYAYTANEWRELEKRILDNKAESLRNFRRFFLGNAFECSCDKQERILIPQNLREYAGFEKDIALVGVLDHFEIWSRERLDKVNKKMEEDLEKGEAKDHLASIGL